MPWDVDKADFAQVSEPQIDRNAAALFFFQAIGIYPGERAHQRSLTVIDVSGGAYDERNDSVLLLKGYMAPQISALEYDLLDELMDDVIGAAQEVAATLGGGFERGAYERALARELAWRKRSVEPQPCQSVFYKGAAVASYSADLIVAGRLPVELVCDGIFSPRDLLEYQNYLRASGKQLGLVIRLDGTQVHWECVVNPDVQFAAA